MARQYPIPGQGAFNEASRRQYFLPGMGAANESGAAMYSASFAEDLSATEGFGTAAAASTTIADDATAGYGYSPVPVYFQPLIQGGYQANEGIARQFLVPGHGFANPTGRARIVPPVTVAASYSIPEASTTLEAQASVGSFNAPTSDFAFASDLPAAQPVFSATYGDISPGDAQYGSVGIRPAAARPGGASAAYGEIAPGETQYGSLGGATYNPTFTAPYVMATHRGEVVEPVSIIDMLGALAAFGESLSESSAPGDGGAASVPGHQALTESSLAGDDMAGVAGLVLALGESILARDSMSGLIDVPTPIYRIIRAEGGR